LKIPGGVGFRGLVLDFAITSLLYHYERIWEFNSLKIQVIIKIACDAPSYPAMKSGDTRSFAF
jgi:hypothetical protein